MTSTASRFIATLELPGGKKLQFLIIFDTTGSMFSCLLRVRRYIAELCQKLFGKLGNVQIAVMAVGDYYDRGTTYITLGTPLTTNSETVTKFVTNVSATNGGDHAEAYELALFEGLQLDWDNNPDTIKLVLLVADDVPHRKGEMNCGVRVEHDWREVTQQYRQKGIRIASAQCLGNGYATDFYQTMPRITDGYYLQLGQFDELENIILGLCYRQESQEKFEQFTRFIEAEQHLSRAAYVNFSAIGSGRTGFSEATARRFHERSDGLIPVPPGRFQIIPVTNVCGVKDFVQDHGFVFVRGAVFYELTMTELIQAKKKVVIMDRLTGDMFTGDAARQLIGAAPGVKLSINPKKFDTEFKTRYRVFVQSTSNNRKMDPGTDVLFMPNYSEENWHS